MGSTSTGSLRTPNREETVFVLLQRSYEPQLPGKVLLLSWTTDQFRYALLPIPLLPQVLRKVHQDKASIVILVPSWPRQFWFPDILRMSIRPPIRIHPFSRRQQNQTSQSRPSSPPGLVFDWASYLECSCSMAVQIILIQRRKDSTRSCYGAKWKCFSTWAQNN